MVRAHIGDDPAPRDRPMRAGQDVVDADPGQLGGISVAVSPSRLLVPHPEAAPDRGEERAVGWNVEVPLTSTGGQSRPLSVATICSTSCPRQAVCFLMPVRSPAWSILRPRRTVSWWREATANSTPDAGRTQTHSARVRQDECGGLPEVRQLRMER